MSGREVAATVAVALIGLAVVAGVLGLASQPGELAAHALDITSAENSLTRFVMAASWLGECWMLLFFPRYAGKMRAEELFDESTGEWAEHDELPKRFALIGQAAMLRLMSSASEPLSKVLVAQPDAGASSIKVRWCMGAEDEVNACMGIFPPETNEPGEDPEEEKGCGCASGPLSSGSALALALIFLRRRRAGT